MAKVIGIIGESFTFHYVSTYTGTKILWALTEHIYIPLCFYLYNKKSYHVLHLHYLHSTMFLLILYLAEICRYSYFIYIPLCFYLYDGENQYDTADTLFTFHYVSTYTRIFSSFNLYYFPLSKLSTSRFAPSLSPPFFIYVLLSVIFLQKYGLCRLPVF